MVIWEISPILVVVEQDRSASSFCSRFEECVKLLHCLREEYY